MNAKIKKEFLEMRVAFGTSGLPLGKRDDINELAIIAHKSGDSSLLKLFEILPPLSDLQIGSTKTKLPEVRKTTVKKPGVTKKSTPPIAKKETPSNNAEADKA